MTKRVSVDWRRVRWSLVIVAVAVEIAAYIVWRLWLRSPDR
jgi:hypothetical protein